MTVQELYDFCKDLGIETYTLTASGTKRGYELTVQDIEIRPEEPPMKGEVWI